MTGAESSENSFTTPTYDNDIFIAVMGATGAGKTTFINTTSGSNLKIGHGLESETKDVALATFHHRGHRIFLIDTPGFDDTHNSDTSILKTIAGWLELAHRGGKRLNGLLYLHRITDIRVSGMSRRNMKLFYKLCGEESMKNVVLCTTMWNKEDISTAEAREQELLSKFWANMTDAGASSARHFGSRESSLEIIEKIMGLPPVQLDIQASLAEGKSLSETEAFREINGEIIALQEKYKGELDEIKQDLDEAKRDNDVKGQRLLEAEQQRLEIENQRLEAERQRLASELTSKEALEKARQDNAATVQKLLEAEKLRLEAEKQRMEAELETRQELERAKQEHASATQRMLDAEKQRLEAQMASQRKEHDDRSASLSAEINRLRHDLEHSHGGGGCIIV